MYLVISLFFLPQLSIPWLHLESYLLSIHAHVKAAQHQTQ